MPDVAEQTAWERALRDPALQDLPYKVETNEYDQIVLSPHKPQHSFRQSDIYDLLVNLVDRPGRPTQEFAVDTPAGVKVPDVVWISADRLSQIPDDAEASPVMPELCVEVVSEGNTASEMERKRRLYFDGGAQEVWTCDEGGTVTFYDPDGERETSTLVPSFPKQIGETK